MSEEKKIGGRAFGETLNVEKFIEEQVALIREQVGDGKVLLALSGGVDSSVVAALLLRAIGDQLYCVHVNHGLMRKGESEQVIKVFREELGANLTYVDATDRFLDKLAGVSEPERKRSSSTFSKKRPPSSRTSTSSARARSTPTSSRATRASRPTTTSAVCPKSSALSLSSR